jgi:acetyltransferase-like isoleucine patch superfamily enzyme
VSGQDRTRRWLQRLVQRIRQDPGYVIATEISTRDLVEEVVFRGRSLLWAQWALRRVGGGRVRFAERGCTIQYRRHCRIGRGSVVEAHARLRCLSRDGVVIGERVTIGKFAILECSGVLWNRGVGIEIGDDSGIGDYNFIGGGGGVRIGRRVITGQRVSIHSQNHRFEDSDAAVRDQGVRQEGVSIGDGCWIGSGVIVLDGVTLGPGCVVAAGSVVTRSFPAGSVIAGVPARPMRSRNGIPAQE